MRAGCDNKTSLKAKGYIRINLLNLFADIVGVCGCEERETQVKISGSPIVVIYALHELTQVTEGLPSCAVNESKAVENR